MSDDINNMEKEYTNAQFRVVVDLQKKLKRVEEENEHLKKLLEQSSPVVGFKVDDIVPGITNEQLICEVQIKLLKDRAMVAELSKEEAQKLQIYVDVLQRVKRKEGDELKVDNIDTSELLNLVEIK